jgi:hypothetical protein
MGTRNSILSAKDVEVLTGIDASKLSREIKAIQENYSSFGWALTSAKELKKGGRTKYLVNKDKLLGELLEKV